MRARIYFVVSALLLSLLSPLFISHAEAAVDSGVGVVTSGLKMYFDPANPSSFISSTVIKDLSGNGYNGTLTKTGSWPDVQTGQGRYLGFDGAGGYIDLPDITSPSNWTGLTFTFYANFGGGAGNFLQRGQRRLCPGRQSQWQKQQKGEVEKWFHGRSVQPISQGVCHLG